MFYSATHFSFPFFIRSSLKDALLFLHNRLTHILHILLPDAPSRSGLIPMRCPYFLFILYVGNNSEGKEIFFSQKCRKLFTCPSYLRIYPTVKPKPEARPMTFFHKINVLFPVFYRPNVIHNIYPLLFSFIKYNFFSAPFLPSCNLTVPHKHLSFLCSFITNSRLSLKRIALKFAILTVSLYLNRFC